MLPLKSVDAAHRFIRHNRLKSAYKLSLRTVYISNMTLVLTKMVCI